ncbi:VanZ family protein [Aliikangiella coralliicola]|uniref:VanZ-like domain-containing protein n=1 Tax=Aliikangiella coralliicola TaxID=2592383 RepID=A0A545U7H2_9GAMM|nr:VanZ family protein [Aliikangiella coralliicola]TQV85416.1 hypothetical protein FLL46_19820 [Aliikangiella coralliicola]
MRSLLWIVITIIVYGSLYPFNFVWPDFSQIAWLDWGISIAHKTTNGDVLSNFLTFIPLGYFAFFYAPLEKTPIRRRAIVILFLGFAFAYLLQMAQFFLPSRVPTVGDAMVNLWGILIGIIVAIIVQQQMQLNPRLNREWHSQYVVPIILVMFWFLYQLFPFFPDWSMISFIDSIAAIANSPYLIWYQCFAQSVFWYCFLTLIKDNPWRRLNYLNTLGLVFVVVLLKLLIAHNDVDFTFIISALIGGVLAFKVPDSKQLVVIVALTAIALVVKNLFPWHQKMFVSNFNWTPLGSYLSGSMWVNTYNFLERLFTFGCLAHFAQAYWGDKIKAILIGLAIVSGIEICQLFISVGQADVTEPILFLVIAYAFSQLAKPEFLPSSKVGDADDAVA